MKAEPQRKEMNMMNNRLLMVISVDLFVLVAPLLLYAQQDSTPPTLVSFVLDSDTVDVRDGPQSVAFTARITDDLSGNHGGCLWVARPSGGYATGACFGDWTRIAGDEHDGTYRSEIAFGQYIEPGIYYVTEFSISDVVGNNRWFFEQDLIAMGFPTKILVLSNFDSTPPTLENFSLLSEVIDVSNGPQGVTFTARITDDLSGNHGGCLWVARPSGGYGASACFGDWTRVSGDEHDGTYQSQFVLPQYIEPGIYYVTEFSISDAVGNNRWFFEPDLIAMGFPTRILVTYNEPPVAEAGMNRTVIVGESVLFDGSASSDPDGSIVAYQWDFGDGYTASDVITTHAFAAAGTYTVTLTVTDDMGATATDTAVVTVRSVTEAIGSLSGVVASFNLAQGISNSLDSKLQNAMEAYQAANAGNRQDVVNRLIAFINAVEAQRGKELTSAQADQLIAEANRILSVL